VSLYQSPPQAHQLVSAVLRLVHSTHYADEASPHWDAEREYSTEQVALAARELVRAVDELPADQRPIGWDIGDLDTTDRLRVRVERLERQLADQNHSAAKGN
jgi:hypothetical protein